MKDKKRFKSMKTKIMLSAILPVVLSFVLICGVVFAELFESLRQTAQADFLQISQRYAHDFETKLERATNYLSILSDDLSARARDEDSGREAEDRKQLRDFVFDVFKDYGLVDGSSVYFESNMYDGKDDEYANVEYITKNGAEKFGTDTLGRICWNFHYETNADGERTAVYLGGGLSGDAEFDLPYYKQAKSAVDKPVYTDPTSLKVDGKNVSMFTLAFPINNSAGEFIGAVTADLRLDDICQSLDAEEIYKTGYVVITNDNGKVIYCPNENHIGGSHEDSETPDQLPADDDGTLTAKTKSIINGKSALVTIQSVYIPQLDGRFYVSVTAPISEINASATKLLIGLVAFAVIIIGAIGVIIFFLIGKLSRPLKEITESVNKIAEGHYDVRIEGDFKGEFEMVKNSVNTLADSIEAYIKESKDSLEILKSILNGLDAVIYVSDPATDEILFINDNMKNLFGISGEVNGQICWKVFQDNFDKRCDFCPCYALDKNPDKSVEWEEHNTVTHRHYRNTDTYINWLDGRKVHLQHSVDVTHMKQLQLNLDRRLKQQSLMSAIPQKFLSGLDLETLITEVLAMTGDFLDVGQASFYKTNEDGVTLVCSNDWVSADGGHKGSLGDKIIVDDEMTGIVEGLCGQSVCLSSNDPGIRALVQKYRTDDYAFMTIPVFVDGNMYGILDFSINSDREWSESDTHLVVLVASLLSGVIERFDMESQLIIAKELAEQGSKSKSEFLSRMSHEIRTPMNAIIGMTRIADGTDDVNKIRYCLSTINSSSIHLLGIINDILDMSKIEAGKFELDNEYFSIEKMLMKICNLVIDKTEQKKQTLHINIGKNMHSSYLGDELRLSQVITNLLSNAVKFTPENGRITLSVDELATEGDTITVRFEIADTGIGMTAEQISRLFTSFEQADGSISRRFGGTGLGLAISKNIIQKMGGDIWVESEKGNGSNFIFEVKMQCGEGRKSGVIYGGINASDLKLLVVDDSKSVREQFVDILNKFQIDCDVADSGESALSLIEKAYFGKKTYDVIFLDSDMPGMDGVDAVKRLQERIDKNTVIVMMTFSQSEDCKAEFKKLGIDRFMTKLLFPSSILNCINEVIGGTIKSLDIKSEQAKKTVDFSKLSILLVDDVDINREIFVSLMEETNMAIDEAENGVFAVQKFKDNPDKYDMIIMDIQMPEMDGYEATRAIRALSHPRAKTIPIIAMTANAFNEDIEKCLESGMNDHVAKPIDVEMVTEKIIQYSK